MVISTLGERCLYFGTKCPPAPPHILRRPGRDENFAKSIPSNMARWQNNNLSLLDSCGSSNGTNNLVRVQRSFAKRNSVILVHWRASWSIGSVPAGEPRVVPKYSSYLGMRFRRLVTFMFEWVEIRFASRSMFVLCIFRVRLAVWYCCHRRFHSTSATYVSSFAWFVWTTHPVFRSFWWWPLRGFSPLKWKNLAVSYPERSAVSTRPSAALRLSSAKSFAEFCLHAKQPANVELLKFWFEMIKSYLKGQ